MSEGAGPLRICVLGDFESIHTRRWLEPFVERGHEMHAVSYYRPQASLPGVQLHVLHDRGSRAEAASASRHSVGSRIPPNLLRLINAFRYQRRGLTSLLRQIAPDILHAHYVPEYGFFAATAGLHPLVVSAWGSDVLVDAGASRLSRWITGYTLRRADLVTSNNEFMSGRLREMGVPAEKLATIVFGPDAFFLEGPESVNARQPEAGHTPTVISTRSLDSPLYNVDLILRAMALLRARIPTARLFVAGAGRLRPRLEALSRQLGLSDSVRFVGWLDPAALRDAFASSEVYVSVPNSDGTSVATLSAMAAGCFPVVSDLPTQHEWIQDGVNGFLVPLGDPVGLAQRLGDALENAALRREAVTSNRATVEERGVWQKNALLMEEWYRRLAERKETRADASVLPG
ncbi:MAG: glycosyltransferase family 4 protein [Dehalococcoidia bacterium]